MTVCETGRAREVPPPHMYDNVLYQSGLFKD
jgi:hypothetical protein